MLQLENSKKSLYKEIQQAYYNAVAAHEKFRSSLDADASARSSTSLCLRETRTARPTSLSLNEARYTFLESESNLARARYEFLLSGEVAGLLQGTENDFLSFRA